MGFDRSPLTHWIVTIILASMIGWESGCTLSSSQEAPPSREAPSTPIVQSPTPFPSPLVISVLPFDDQTQQPSLAWLRAGLSDALVSVLAQLPQVLVIQRDHLTDVLKEQTFQLSGRVADAHATRVGRLVGATVLITGRMLIMDSRLRLTAQLWDVERGIVLRTAESEGPLPQLQPIIRDLTTRIMASLPPRPQSPGDPVPPQLQAIETNLQGEALTREGRLFQALEAYEQAIQLDPSYQSAQTNYHQTLQVLPLPELSQLPGPPAASPEQHAHRLLTRLVSEAFTLTVTDPMVQPSSTGSVTLQATVRLAISPHIVPTLHALATSLHLPMQLPEAPTGLWRLSLAQHPSVRQRLQHDLQQPRRLYLHLTNAQGTPLALLSQLRGWQLHDWLTMTTDGVLELDLSRTQSRVVMFRNLPRAAMTAPVRFSLHLEPTPQEQAVVRVELEPERDREVSTTPAAPRLLLAPVSSELDQALRHQETRLQVIATQAWNPPLTTRPWSTGAMPGNVLTAVVVTWLNPETLDPITPPAIRSPSPDPDFNAHGLATTTTVLQQWRTEGPRLPPAPPGLTSLKLRITYRLRMDLPLLNRVESVHTSAPSVFVPSELPPTPQ